MEEIRLKVHDGTAVVAFINVGTGETVSTFKRLIEQECSCPPAQQRIIHRGRVLEDRQTLSSYGIKNDDTVHFVRGAAPATRTTVQAQSNSTATNMANIMNSPIMRSLMDNPEVLRSMMTSNPQIRALMDANPQLNHVLNDPAMLRQTMEMARNPAAMQQVVRNQDLAMSQIENTPGGFNALSRMYHDVQEPMMDAMSDAGGDSASVPGAVSQEGALPNPWAAAPGDGTRPGARMGMGMGGAYPFSATAPAGNSPFDMPLNFGGGGMPDMTTMMQNPAMQRMMQQMLSDPTSPGIPAPPLFTTPPASAAANEGGGAADMTAGGAGFSGGLLADMGAATASSMSRTAAGASVASSSAVSSSAQVMSTPVPVSWQNATLPMRPTTSVPSSEAPPESLPSAPESTIPAVNAMYATQMGQLGIMGFSNGAANLKALQQSGGNLNAAVERLLGNFEG